MNISSMNSIGLSAPAEVAQPRQLSEDQRTLIQAVRSVNAADLFGEENQVTYAFDRTARQMVIRVVNRANGNVVNQIPAEYLLKLAEKASGG